MELQEEVGSELFRAAFEASLVAALITDQHGTIRFVNTEAAKLFGYEKEELIGQKVEMLVPRELRPMHKKDRNGYLAEPIARPMGKGRELSALRKDGTEFPVEIGLNPIRAGGELFVISKILDLRDRKTTEQLLRQTAERYREASRLKDEFLAVLSHELRTPMNAVMGWAMMLKAGNLDPVRQKHAIDVIARSAKAEMRLIEDILDVSQLITGMLKVEPEPLDAIDAIRNAVDAAGPACRAKDIQIKLDLDTSATVINAESRRFEQILWNLLSNAVKFTPKGGLITVELRSAGGVARISVKDNGRGIRKDFLPHVFERFRQEDGSYTRQHGGLGLGLSIVKHLVELHGGTVRAESDGPDKGATFWVELPLVDTEANLAEQVREETDEAELRGKSVLVVDDDPWTLDFLAALFEGLGMRVLTAISVREGLKHLDHFRPDVILSDIEMPEEDGFELVRRVRSKPGLEKVPLIAFTAHAREEVKVEALRAGYDMHLSKPMDPKVLTGRICELLRRE